MRFGYVVLLIAGLLAACGSPTTEPTTPPNDQTAPESATTQPPTAEPTLPLPERRIVTDVPLPIPGTLIAAPATEDPSAGEIFTRILYEQSGGIAGRSLTIEVRGDGTVTRNGAVSTISPAQVEQLNDIINQLNFFGLQGAFTAPGTSADIITYQVTVERAGSERTIVAQDGFIPGPLDAFLSVLGTLGQP